MCARALRGACSFNARNDRLAFDVDFGVAFGRLVCDGDGRVALGGGGVERRNESTLVVGLAHKLLLVGAQGAQLPLERRRRALLLRVWRREQQ